MDGRSKAEAMAEFAQQMWERYFKPKVIDDLLSHSLDGYKATVVTNNLNGTLTVVRPFDSQTQTLKCPPALAKSAERGDQVLVVQLGEASNSFVLCGTDMSGFGDGGGAQYRPLSYDFSDIVSDGTFTEVVENEEQDQVSTEYAVTRDANGRIDSVVDQSDGWETTVRWGTKQLLPAADVSFDPTGTTIQSRTAQGAIVELANGGGGGGGGGAAESIIATVEATSTASKNYTVKEYLILNKVLYRVTSPISAGDTITSGTNVTPAVLGDDAAAHIKNTSNPHQVTAAQAGAMPDTATLDDIPNGTTYAKPTSAQVAQIGTNQTNISTIEGKIPSAASTSNQLADKAFVTDSITQGTAIFRGSFATKAALLAVQWQTSDPNAANYVSNNDYAVVLDDETQNDECWRYIYVTGTGWTPQYRINESPLTQAQLDAINSGATAAIIGSVADKLDKTGDGSNVTATFTQASTRANLTTGEKLSVMFGKIAKWFADLGTAAFASISSATPQMDGTASAGSSGQVSDAGHTHPSDTSRLPVYGMGENLLDNAYFVGGGSQLGDGIFPINQRGQSTYTGAVYGPDRWKGANNQSVMTLVSGGLQLSTTDNTFRIWQQLCDNATKDRLSGKTGTISVIEDGVLYTTTGTFGTRFDAVGAKYTYSVNTSNNEICRIGGGTNGAAVVTAIKVELGSQQTLAHQENGTWVLNEIPDYGEELRKCQRYYIPYAEGSLCGSTFGAQILSFVVPVPCKMAKNPTVGTLKIVYNGGDITSNYNQAPSYTARAGQIAVYVASGSARSFGTSGAYGVQLQNISAEP